MRYLLMAGISGVVIGASVGGCTGPTAPSFGTVTVTHSPAVGATVANGTEYEIRVDQSGGNGRFFDTVAFVRDDGAYSIPFMCGETSSSGGSGASSASLRHDVRTAIDPLNFAIGRRVNLVVLFSSRGPCGAVGPGAQPVDPSWADLGRKDVALNWLVGGL